MDDLQFRRGPLLRHHLPQPEALLHRLALQPIPTPAHVGEARRCRAGVVLSPKMPFPLSLPPQVPLSIIVSPEHRVDAEEDFVLDPSFRLDDSPVSNWV
ncbi:hypothetical protein ZWY2020_048066 [Hordeum vulgare]|nr:hypothetical protein ZWY2020_048066 [Hordeum vulgare]